MWVVKFKYNRQKFPQVATDCEVDYKLAKGFAISFPSSKNKCVPKKKYVYPIVTTQEESTGGSYLEGGERCNEGNLAERETLK